MKRHTSILTALSISVLAVVVYFAQAIHAQQSHMQFEALTQINVDAGGTVRISADSQNINVNIDGEVYVGTFEADALVEPSGEASGRLIFILTEGQPSGETTEPIVYVVVGGDVEISADGAVEGFALRLKTADGQPAAADGDGGNDGGDGDGLDIILFDIVAG